MSNSITRRAMTLMLVGGALAPTAAFAQGKTYAVTIKDFGFEPANLTVRVGDKITFTNADRAPHTATATSGAFDTPRLKRGQSATVTVSQKGTLDYFCKVHPRMKAKVIAR